MAATNGESLSDEVPAKGTRAARLEVRVTNEQKTLLQRAATILGRSLSDFLVSSAQETATRVIQEHETIRLSKADRTALVTTLLKPPEPPARLAKAAKAYREKTGL